MKSKIKLLPAILCACTLAGCGMQSNEIEEIETQSEMESIENETLEVDETDKQSTTDIETTHLSEKLYEDEQSKVCDFVQGDKTYQLKLYYKEDGDGALVSHASVLDKDNIIQEINFETYNAKEQALEDIEIVGSYEAPLQVYRLPDMIEQADYNWDGYVDFRIEQALYSQNASAFLFLWDKDNECFKFEMRELGTSCSVDEVHKQLIYEIEGGIYPQKRYYGVDEKGVLYLSHIEWGTWQNEELGLEYSKWIYVETQDSVNADELKSNEKLWEEDSLDEWETEVESVLSEWDVNNAMDTVYFTVYSDGQIKIASTKEELEKSEVHETTNDENVKSDSLESNLVNEDFEVVYKGYTINGQTLADDVKANLGIPEDFEYNHDGYISTVERDWIWELIYPNYTDESDIKVIFYTNLDTDVTTIKSVHLEKVETSRGITVGDSINDVYEAYGLPTEEKPYEYGENYKELNYIRDNQELSFVIDGESNVIEYIYINYNIDDNTNN